MMTVTVSPIRRLRLSCYYDKNMLKHYEARITIRNEICQDPTDQALQELIKQPKVGLQSFTTLYSNNETTGACAQKKCCANPSN